MFDRLGRAVCEAGCLPRKELYEAWEMAKRVRRHLRAGRVVDIAGGHGLLAHALLILDDTSPCAVVVDRAVPASAEKVHNAVIATWPRLAGRVTFESADLDGVPLDAGDVVVSCHACGALTDRVLERAAAVRAAVAVLPCCHDLTACDTGDLAGWTDGALAIDMTRALRLRAQDYQIWPMKIPAEITAKNRLLIGRPRSQT